jgi:hypothetical protein
MPWRNHAHGSKHRHFRYPSTWRCRVNPGRFGGACGRRSELQCRGRDRPLAQHSPLWLTGPAFEDRHAADSANPRQADRINNAYRGKLAANPAGCAARTDRVTSPARRATPDWFFHDSPSRGVALQQSQYCTSRDGCRQCQQDMAYRRPFHHPALDALDSP